MQSKTGNWVMALGAVIAVIGLVVIPAGLGQESADRNLLGVGATIFSIGAFVAAMGLYLKAKAQLSERTESIGNLGGETILSVAVATVARLKYPVIQCKVHQQHLCGVCLAEHYDFRSCVYAPTTRRGAAAKSMSARARLSTRSIKRPKLLELPPKITLRKACAFPSLWCFDGSIQPSLGLSP